MYQSFLTFIKKHRLFEGEEHLLLGVSGGVDSMVLAHLTLKSGMKMAVAHVNYKLRGVESDADAELVKSWCEKNQVEFHLMEVDPAVYDSHQSTQMVARDIRYRFFAELSQVHSYTKIVTAHNANDNVETVLFNLTKGTGIAGLTGIAPKKGHVVRPLLFAAKEEIYDYARSEGISWREDQSNAKSKYSRNLIRNEVIPLLRKINPSVEHTFEDTLIRIKGAAETVKQKKKELIKSHLKRKDPINQLDVDWVQDDHQSLLLLGEIIKDYGFRFSDSKNLHSAIINQQSGASFSSEIYEINVDRKRILISRRKEDLPWEIRISSETKEVKTPVGRLIFDRCSTIPDKFSPGNVAFLDADKITYPLVVRTWKQGDRFTPLGMRGKKKVSDFMIDLKIPVTLKRKVMVIETAGEILWVVGYRVADPYKITPTTQKVLKIEVKDA